MTDRILTKDLLGRLERHYIKPGEAYPGGVFIPECGVNGAWGAGSRCDALYVGFTSTSGRILVGHELKVSRADWRHELAQSGKADVWADQCHAWYVVAPSTAIVPPDELPPGWGLMVINPRSKVRLEVKVKAATKGAEHAPSWDAVRSIMARQDTLRAQAIGDVRIKARDEVNAEVERRMTGQPVLSKEQTQRLYALDQFEANLGIKLHAWDEQDGQVRPEVLAAALGLVKAVNGLPRHPLGHLETAARQLADQVQAVSEAAAAWRAIGGRP